MTKTKKIRPYVEESVAKKQTAKIAKESFKIVREFLTDNACTGLLKKLGKAPVISWKKFGFNVCGRTYSTGEIEMNINFLYSKDAREFIESTAKHELAHLITLRLFNEFGHNERWRLYAKLIGDDGERLATYADPDNKPVRKNQVTIECPKCHTKIKMTTRTYENIKRYDNYVCSKCKASLTNAKVV